MASPAGQFHPWRLILTFLVITAGLYALVLFTPGSNTPKLGIDLQGGTRITLTAKTSDGSTPSNQSMKLARNIMERRVNGSGVAGAQVQIDGSNQLVITVPGQDNLPGLTRSAQLNIRPVVTAWVNPALRAPLTSQPVTPSVEPSQAPTSGATVSGAPAPTSGAATSSTVASSTTPSSTAGSSAAVTAESGQGLRNAAQALAAGSASTEPSVTEQAPDASSAAVPASGAPASNAPVTTAPSATASDAAANADGTGNSDGAEPPPAADFPTGSNPKVLTQPAGSDADAFKAWETAAAAYAQTGGGPTCQQIKYFEGLDDPAKPLLACDQDQSTVYLLEETLIPGTEIDNATSGLDPQGHGWVINVDFKSTGFKIWSKYTTGHVGTQTAFTLDGEVLSAPNINEPITTPGTMVSGNFDPKSAKSLADSLKFGALPLAFDRQESQQVSAELGFQYLKAGLIAGGIGLALVIIYCLVYYRLLGLITILSLLLSGALIYAVMVLLGRWIGLSLDMAGIAGLIIAIGITADSFVVYFERIKDEVREGRTFRSSVPRGWTRAKRTILSADAVSFLSAAILYLLAVGDVKGFAFTLGLSTVLDLVVVFLVTHPLVAVMSRWDIFKHPIWSGLGSVARAGQEHRAATARLTAKEA